MRPVPGLNVFLTPETEWSDGRVFYNLFGYQKVAPFGAGSIAKRAAKISVYGRRQTEKDS